MNGSITTRKKRVGDKPPPYLNPELLRAIYQCRYLTVPHLKRLFPQTYNTSSDTTPRRHLRSLEQAGYLVARRLTKETPKIFSPKAVKIHHYLRQHYQGDTFHATREESIRWDYLSHELAITDIQIDFIHASEAHRNLTLLDQHRRYFHQPAHLTYRDPQGIRRRLEPDLGVLLNITSPKSTFPLLHFIEVDLGNESPNVIRRKLTAYPQWFEQTGEQYLLDLYRTHLSPNPRPAFRLLFITQVRRSGGADLNRLNQLMATAQKLPTPLRKQTFFTTNQALLAVRPSRSLLTADIWQAVRPSRGKPQALFS